MSSSEEYLDSLLKAIMEGNSNEAPSPSMEQDAPEADDQQGTSVPEEPDMTMNMDDIEAVFVSMGEETMEEETSEAVPAGDGMLSNEQMLDDGMLSSDEQMLDDGMLSDDQTLDNGMLSDDQVSDDGMLSDELVMDDSMLPDELSVDEGTLSDELSLDEVMPSDGHMLNEESVTDELAMGDEMLSDELPLGDNLLSDELSMDDAVLQDELILDEGMLSDELTSDDSLLSDELVSDGEAMTDDFALIETVTDDFAIDEAVQDKPALDESMEESTATDDLSLDELGLGDLGLEDFGAEEKKPDEPEAGADFAQEDGTERGASSALEEIGDDDADLSALLASMDDDDELLKINDLLEKSDRGLTVGNDLMAMLGDGLGGAEGTGSDNLFSIEGNPEDIREITPEELAEKDNPKSKQQKKKEEKERKKREKQAKKAKNKNASPDENAGDAGADNLTGLLSGMDETGDKAEKKGTFTKFLDFLLEEDEEEGNSIEGGLGGAGAGIGNLSVENKQLLAELQAEDQKNAKKKDKKAKKDKAGSGKGKAGTKPKKAKKGKPKKEKPKKGKPKKEKKTKERIEEEPQVPEKKLSKKKVISVFLFCATIAACIIVVTILLPEQLEKQEARVAFDQSQYTQVYGLLYGKELSEEDEILLQKSGTILQLQRKLDSYQNYEKMDMPLEALNALLEGVSRYQNLRDDAELYNVSAEVTDIYEQILDTLADNYGLSESDALDIIASKDDITYSKRIQAVISGEGFGMGESALPEGKQNVPSEEKQDVLPEEEEIIDRLEGTEME